MTQPVLRISVARDVAGEIDMIVHIEGASIRGALRPDDAKRLVRDLSFLIDAIEALPTIAEIRGEASVSDFAEGRVP